jgi:neurotransmitter:Na+ symporter, NSS family
VTERLGVFSSRWGMMLAMLGMAVGTGNIWRFPRVAATNGGGSFLVAWVVFLLLWSVPLILIEFGMGKGTRYGPVGAFARIMGRNFAWMGAWIAWTATAIMFYYAIVMGWTIRYLWAALTGELPLEGLDLSDPASVAATTAALQSFWENFAFTPNVLVVHALALAMAVFVVSRGVRGIESAAKVLIPTLVLLIVVLAVRAVTLPGATAGLNFLFTPDFGALAEPRIWLAALTQNAWDTGAGWGLIVAYAVYMRPREDTTINAFMLGFGNNSMSLLAGIMVLCTVFAMLPDAASQIVGAGNEGLTFIWVPALFAQLPLSRLLMVIFFLALMFAAWTSLIAMIELATRVLSDAGVPRGRAIAMVAGAGFLLGVPSALSRDVFLNQDWVWGVGLMLSGLFFAIAALRYGVTRFRENFINGPDSDIHIGPWWDWVIRLVVVQAVVLIGWWLYQVRGEPFLGAEGVGLLAIQWGVALALFIAMNGWLVRRTQPDVNRQLIDDSVPAGR